MQACVAATMELRNTLGSIRSGWANVLHEDRQNGVVAFERVGAAVLLHGFGVSELPGSLHAFFVCIPADVLLKQCNYRFMSAGAARVACPSHIMHWSQCRDCDINPGNVAW
jgi:hypothetical protein